MMFRFPFTNFHELNLDWILSVVKQFADLVPPMETAVDDVQQALGDATEAVQKSAEALTNANEAVETANEAKEIAEEAAQGVIADGAVTTPKIENSAVNTSKLADGAVTTPKIDSGAVTTTKLSDSAVTNAKIENSAVTTAKIADEAVTTSKIEDGAVSSAKIADEAVTMGKLSEALQKKLTALDITDTVTLNCSVGSITQATIYKCNNVIMVSFVLTLTAQVSAMTDYVITMVHSNTNETPILRSLIGGSNNPSIGHVTASTTGNLMFTPTSTISAGTAFWLNFIYICQN